MNDHEMIVALQHRINLSNMGYKVVGLSMEFFPLLDSIKFIALIQGPDHKRTISLHVPTILVDSHEKSVIADLLWINTGTASAGQWNERLIGTRMTRPAS